MNTNDISTQLLYTTVPIFAKKKNEITVSGTGFIFTINEENNLSMPFLITNYHVLKDVEEGSIEFHIVEDESLVSDKIISVYFDETISQDNKLGNLDLIAVPLAATINQLRDNDINIFFRSIDQGLIPSSDQINGFAAIEDITFIGYPSNFYDEKNKIPIVRQGITATPIWNSFNRKEEFLIDAGVFPGSSGSPVFLYNQGAYSTMDGMTIGNRLIFLGVVSQTISMNTTDPNYLNLGVVINSRAMFNELEEFVKQLKN